MTNQIEIPAALINELQAANATAYGLLVGQLVVKELSLNKQVQAMASRIAHLETEVLTLGQEKANLIEAVIAKEAEIDRIIKTGLTADQIAIQGNAVIAGVRNEKAAPG